jgi:hypothetical protein
MNTYPAKLLDVRLHSRHTRRGPRYYMTAQEPPRAMKEISEREWLRRMSIECDSGINRRGAPVPESEQF